MLNFMKTVFIEFLSVCYLAMLSTTKM